MEYFPHRGAVAEDFWKNRGFKQIKFQEPYKVFPRLLGTKVMEFCIERFNGMPHVLKAVAEDVDKFPRAPASFRNSTTFVLEVMKKYLTSHM